MNKNKLAAGFLACLLLGRLGMAQDASNQGQTRERLRANINTLMLVRMTQALDLSEEQAAKLYPALTRIEKDKAELQRRLGKDVQDLRAAAQKPGIRDADLLDMVRRIRESRLAIRQRDDEFEAILDQGLTPLQKAKYVIFTVDFYRGMGEKVLRAREMRGKITRKP